MSSQMSGCCCEIDAIAARVNESSDTGQMPFAIWANLYRCGHHRCYLSGRDKAPCRLVEAGAVWRSQRCGVAGAVVVASILALFD